MHRGLIATAAAAAGILLGGCQHRTLNGTVRLVGPAPRAEVLLMPTSGGPGVPLAGPPSLEQVIGLDVAAVGTQEGRVFRVDRFTVVSANGIPATDGRLLHERDRLYLATPDGSRHALINPPPGLRNLVGRRVWVSGPLDREPVAYGMIE